jgi:hypothetical protein
VVASAIVLVVGGIPNRGWWDYAIEIATVLAGAAALVALVIALMARRDSRRSAAAAESAAETGAQTALTMADLLEKQEAIVAALHSETATARESLELAWLVRTEERWAEFLDATVVLDRTARILLSAKKALGKNPGWRELRDGHRRAEEDHERAKRRFLAVLPTVPGIDDERRKHWGLHGQDVASFPPAQQVIGQAKTEAEKKIAELQARVHAVMEESSRRRARLDVGHQAA